MGRGSGLQLPLAAVVCLALILAVGFVLRAAGLPEVYAQTVGGMPKPTGEAAQPGATSSETERLLASIQVPVRDRLDLARRFRLSEQPVPAVVNAAQPSFSLGTKLSFWVGETDTQRHFEATALLRYVGEHSYWWIQEGYDVLDEEVEASAKVFEDKIYPTNRAFFGSEWSPGVDNDPRIAVLNARFSGAAGYYSSSDQFSRLVNPYSNEREMIYLSLDSARPGTQQYEAILAHEFQHMVHWHLDSNEDSWVNEGCSELAARLCGYGSSGATYAFGLQSDTQLTGWGLSPDEDTLPHYGASYLWMEYFLQRLGPQALKALVAEPLNGIEGFERVLSQIPGAPAFEELFADWVVANALAHDHGVDRPQLPGAAQRHRQPVRHRLCGAGAAWGHAQDRVLGQPEGAGRAEPPLPGALSVVVEPG